MQMMFFTAGGLTWGAGCLGSSSVSNIQGISPSCHGAETSCLTRILGRGRGFKLVRACKGGTLMIWGCFRLSARVKGFVRLGDGLPTAKMELR